MKWPLSWNAGIAKIALAHFLVAHLDAERGRASASERLLVDHLLEDLLLDARAA